MWGLYIWDVRLVTRRQQLTCWGVSEVQWKARHVDVGIIIPTDGLYGLQAECGGLDAHFAIQIACSPPLGQELLGTQQLKHLQTCPTAQTCADDGSEIIGNQSDVEYLEKITSDLKQNVGPGYTFCHTDCLQPAAVAKPPLPLVAQTSANMPNSSNMYKGCNSSSMYRKFCHLECLQKGTTAQTAEYQACTAGQAQQLRCVQKGQEFPVADRQAQVLQRSPERWTAAHVARGRNGAHIHEA